MSGFDKEYSIHAMAQLQPMMNEVYKNNMRYIEKYHRILYKDIKKFEKTYQNPAYSLVFTNNYFNLLINSSDELLYKVDAKEDAINRANQITFDKTASFDTLNKAAYSSTREIKMSQSAKELVPLNDIDKFNKYIDIDKDIKLKKIYKFIFIGSLLGTHLLEIDKKINAKYYLLLEPDMEIFYHSLFVTDYNTIATKSTLCFSIGEDKANRIYAIKEFMSVNADLNFITKYHLVSNNYQNIIEQIVVALTDTNPLAYNYHVMVNQKLKQGGDNIRKDYKFLIENKILTKHFFKDKPVLIVSPGPSLADNMEWLKRYKDRFIIVAFVVSLKKLYHNGIKPDITINVDAQELVKTFVAEIDDDYLKDMIFIATQDCRQTLLDRFDFDNIYLVELLNSRKEKSIKDLDGWSVGEITYHILLKMNVKKLYLLGTDLSLKDDGSTHDSSHQYSNKKNLSQEINYDRLYKRGIIEQSEQIVEVKGNFRKKVLTNLTFNRNLIKYNEISELYLKNFQSVYNLSDGAYIDGTIPLRISDMKMDKFKPLNTRVQLKELFDKCSEISFTPKEINIAKKELQNIKQINDKYDYLKSFVPKSYKKYKKELYSYYESLSVCDVFLIATLHNYFLVIHNLLEYEFNDDNLSKDKRKKLLKKFFKIELKQIENIVQEYMKYLEAIEGKK